MTKTENPAPRSFYARKPNRIACYAGWGRGGGGGGTTFKVVTLSYRYHDCSFSPLALRRTLLGLTLSVRLIESQIRAVKEGNDQL